MIMKRHKFLYDENFLFEHTALKWLLQFKNPEKKIARWIKRLQTYDFEVVYRKCTQHENYDALSR